MKCMAHSRKRPLISDCWPLIQAQNKMRCPLNLTYSTKELATLPIKGYFITKLHKGLIVKRVRKHTWGSKVKGEIWDLLQLGRSFVGAVIYTYHDLGMISPKVCINLCADNQCLFLWAPPVIQMLVNVEWLKTFFCMCVCVNVCVRGYSQQTHKRLCLHLQSNSDQWHSNASYIHDRVRSTLPWLQTVVVITKLQMPSDIQATAAQVTTHVKSCQLDFYLRG